MSGKDLSSCRKISCSYHGPQANSIKHFTRYVVGELRLLTTGLSLNHSPGTMAPQFEELIAVEKQSTRISRPGKHSDTWSERR